MCILFPHISASFCFLSFLPSLKLTAKAPEKWRLGNKPFLNTAGPPWCHSAVLALHLLLPPWAACGFGSLAMFPKVEETVVRTSEEQTCTSFRILLSPWLAGKGKPKIPWRFWQEFSIEFIICEGKMLSKWASEKSVGCRPSPLMFSKMGFCLRLMLQTTSVAFHPTKHKARNEMEILKLHLVSPSHAEANNLQNVVSVLTISGTSHVAHTSKRTPLTPPFLPPTTLPLPASISQKSWTKQHSNCRISPHLAEISHPPRTTHLPAEVYLMRLQQKETNTDFCLKTTAKSCSFKKQVPFLVKL